MTPPPRPRGLTTTQELLGNGSFQVLGLDITEGMTVFGVLKQYKDSCNMTEVQSDSMRALAEESSRPATPVSLAAWTPSPSGTCTCTCTST